MMKGTCPFDRHSLNMTSRLTRPFPSWKGWMHSKWWCKSKMSSNVFVSWHCILWAMLSFPCLHPQEDMFPDLPPRWANACIRPRQTNLYGYPMCPIWGSDVTPWWMFSKAFPLPVRWWGRCIGSGWWSRWCRPHWCFLPLLRWCLSRRCSASVRG